MAQLTLFSTDLGMRSALGIPSNVSQSETKDSFTERTAPFVGEVSKDGKTFLEYFSDPGNPEMVTLANDGIVGWLNVGGKSDQEKPTLTWSIETNTKGASHRLSLVGTWGSYSH